jgi:hypothetical protein
MSASDHGRQRESLVGTATLRLVHFQLRTSSGAAANSLFNDKQKE